MIMAVFLTPVGVLSYPHLFVPKLPRKPKPTDRRSYSATLLFDAKAIETADYKALVAEAMRVGREAFGDKFELLLQDGKLKMPFRKDVASSGYDANKFVRFIGARNTEDPIRPKPQIIDGAKNPITDPTLVFPGVRARLSVTVFAFDNESKGVSLGLRNCQIVGNKNDPRLDSFTNAEDEFGEVEPDPEDTSAATAGGTDAAALAAMLG